ncbi:MAG: NapC/NirT family cytochrome c [Gammaproteobacteria bacterium]
MSINEILEKLKRPSAASLGSLLIGGFVVGIVFWGGFNTAMEATNTEAFCITCHEMEENVFQEYKDTVHYSNRTGVRATCPDCHVPKPWVHKMVRKIQASNELLHKALGSVDTPEKFEAKRLKLAQNVWRSMKATDSRECRNCHNFESMDFTEQQRRAVNGHSKGLEQGQTCIDCHKGIAHSLPAMYEVDPSVVTGSAGH